MEVTFRVDCEEAMVEELEGNAEEGRSGRFFYFQLCKGADWSNFEIGTNKPMSIQTKRYRQFNLDMIHKYH